MSVCGIDVGAGGAFSLLSDKGELLYVRDMPVVTVKGKRRVIAAGVRQIMLEWQPRIVCIERSIALRQQSADASMHFGRAAGLVEGVITGMGIAASLVYPITWKKAMGVSSDKGSVREVVQRMFPQQHRLFVRTKDDGRAEATLIGLFQIMKGGIYTDDDDGVLL